MDNTEIDIQKFQATKPRHCILVILHTYSPLTRMFIRLNISANQVTFLSCAAGVMSVLGIHVGYKALSILLYYFYTVFDCMDGWVARYTGTASSAGHRLDLINHTIVTVLLFVEIAVRSGEFMSCTLVILLFVYSMHVPSYDVRILGRAYDIINFITPTFPLELSIYFGIIFNRFELTIVSHLLVHGATLCLTVVTKIKEWYGGRQDE